MPKTLETVEIDIDGNLGRINKCDFDPKIHKLWVVEAVESGEEVPDVPDEEVDETPEDDEDDEEGLTLAEQVNDLSTWTQFEAFVADNQLEFDTARGEHTLKVKKAMLLEQLAQGD